MNLHMKAHEHLRITNDQPGVGFTIYIENNILHVNAKASDDLDVKTEIVMPDAPSKRKPMRRAA
jgi:hypothetical protein